MAKRWTSQITPPSPAVRGEATPVSQSGFRRLVPGKGQNLTLLSIELHADTRYAFCTASMGTLAREQTLRCCCIVCGRHSPHNAILMEMWSQGMGQEASYQHGTDMIKCCNVLQGNPAA